MRLRELCAELLGPARSSGTAAAASPDTPAGGAAAAASAAQQPAGAAGDAAGGPPGNGGGGGSGQPGRWQPAVLGIDKRELLRREVLRDIGRNRANQRLVNEFAELLAAQG